MPRDDEMIALRAEIERLKAGLEVERDMQEEINTLRAALEFYANFEEGETEIVTGRIARAALASPKERASS